MNRPLPIFLLFLLGTLEIAWAEPSISSALSETVTSVDHPVQLEIRVENARITRPPTVFVNGLSISFAGSSRGAQRLNFQASTVTLFTYIVTATHEGVFEIPPIEISTGGKSYRTASLTLQVVHGTAARSGTTTDKPYFAELVIPKESAYVGEQIPIELRFYFNPRIQYQPYPQGQYPIIEGEDFVTKKYSEPGEKQLELDGRIYRVVIYKTALTGVKPGRLELHSATQGFLISTPFGPRGPGLLDPFENSGSQVVDVKTNGASIEIKPLPAADRPADFSGAVGDFTLTTSVHPEKVKAGDPLSMKVEIRGLGNFDRMEQPTLTNTDGWHIYQPTEAIEMLDDLGLSANKTFSYPLVPEKKVANLPTVRFSYFNPNSEKYVVLNSLPLSIAVDGELAPKTQDPGPAVTSSASEQPKLAPAPDILDIQLRAPAPASFTPLIREPAFWIAQAVPACVLLAFALISRFRRKWIAGRPLRAVKIERRSLRTKIVTSSDRSDVLQAAVRLLELDCTTKAPGRKQMSRSLEEWISTEDLPGELRRELRDLIEERSARIYGHLGSESLSEEERSRIINLLDRWKAYA